MEKTLLEVKGLKKYFKTRSGLLHAVDDVSFRINEGETLGVVGESGCGKSTLGRVILHLLEPTDGQILFDGKDITRPGSKEELKELRKDMQMVFQDPFSSINPRMSVSSIIGEPLKIYKICKSSAEYEEKVCELMDTVGLARRFYNAYPHELDGGRRQRIGIARALAINPRFIVCDEPVSALDVSIQAQILNLMMDLQDARKLTYIFITHDLSVVRHISDRILVMYLGQVVEFCSSKELFSKQIHPYTRALISALPIAKVGAKKGRIILKGEIKSPIDPSEGCRFASRCNHACDICRQKTPELREIVPGHQVACHLAEQFV